MQAVGANFQVLEAIADASKGRVLFSYGTGADKGAGTRAAQALDKLCEGRDITAISHVRGSGYMFGLQAGLPCRGQAWRELAGLDLAGRLAAINDNDTCARLIDEARQPNATQLPMERVFYLGSGDRPDYTNEQSLKSQAEAAGEHWSETYLRLSRESNGRGLFNFRMFSASLQEQANLFRSEHIFPGLGDAGAHVSQIMDAGWSSFMLSYWQRQTGFYSMGQAIRKMTSGPARVVGLTDRGLLAKGMRADINVFDADQVGELQPELVRDFPGGAPRYIQKSIGFKATIVNGQISLLDGELTGARAGKVLRHGA